MSGSRDATYTPDGGRASDATTAASTKEAAARGLVRTEAVREAGRLALVRASEPADDRDTGAHAPAAAARGASTTSRLRRLLRRRDRRADTAPDDATPHGESSDEAPDAPDATSVAEGAPNPMGANADGGASGAKGARIANGASGANVANGAHGIRGGANGPAGTAPIHAPSPVSTDAAPGRADGVHDSSVGARPTTRGRGKGLAGSVDVTPRPHGMRPTTSDAPAMEPAPPDAVATPGPPARDVTAGRARLDGSPAREVRANPTLGTARAARRREIARRRAAATAGRSVTPSVARTTTSAATRAAAPATTAVAAPIAVCAVALWATFLILVSILAGGAADEDRARGAAMVADVASEAYETGANRGDYHWKGQAFRDYVGGTTGAWDAAFCSWCLGQAGFVESGLVGRYATVDSFLARFEGDPAAGEVHGPAEATYAPEPGDLVVWDIDTDHARIGVVTEVTGDGSRVTCVAGDSAGGEAGSYDRDADGYGGYVAATERDAHAAGTGYLHPHYSADAASATR